jgi:hypothetical protein
MVHNTQKDMKYSLQIMVLSLLCTLASAETVRLDLKTISCPDVLSGTGVGGWGADFNLGVQFSAIERVSIEWSGSIKGNLLHFVIASPPYSQPWDLFATATLHSSHESPFWQAGTGINGGQDTYPAWEPFDRIQDFRPSWLSPNWDDLMDGRSRISLSIGIGDAYLAQPDRVELGAIQFSKAILVVEGTIVPEPITLALLALGGLALGHGAKRRVV